MSLILCWDTETTGLPLFSQPSEDPGQPHMAQIAAVLFEESTRQAISSMNVIVRPEGWEIPDEVARVHGITTEKALAVGIPEWCALSMFHEMWKVSSARLAFNEPFDARIMRIAYKRYRDDEHADAFKAGTAICAAKMATPVVQLPPTAKMKAAGRNHFKTPNLGEAYKFFTGKTLENAHSALVDVKACMEVYFRLQDMQASESAAQAAMQ